MCGPEFLLVHFLARSVIAADYTHAAVFESLPQLFVVPLFPERRINFTKDASVGLVLGKHQVLRTGLGGNVDSFSARPRNHSRAFANGHVHDVERALGHSRELDTMSETVELANLVAHVTPLELLILELQVLVLAAFENFHVL